MTPKELGIKYNRNSGTIIGKLKALNVFIPVNYRFTKEDDEMLRKYYTIGNWDEIHKRLPNVSRGSIHTYCYKHGIKAESYFWSDEDIKLLKENYEKYSTKELYDLLDRKFTEDAISTKLLKIGISRDRTWTEEEKKILNSYYGTKDYLKLKELLPNRTWQSILTMAKILGIKNYMALEVYWSEEQSNFISDNYKIMSDIELSNYLNKDIHSVQEKRRRMGLLRIGRYGSSTYGNLQKFIRGNINTWKTKSMELCNYECVLTGSKSFEIHHLYSFSNIFEDFVEKYNIEIKDDFSEYSDDELNDILLKFKEEHDKKLGVCVRKDLHILFHKMYGKDCNERQWNKFVEQFLNNELEIKNIQYA